MLYVKVLSLSTEGSTACIFRHIPKWREATPSWELRTGKPRATLPNAHNSESRNLELRWKGLPKKSVYDHVPKHTFNKALSREALSLTVSV